MQIHEITLANKLTEANLSSLKSAFVQGALKGTPGLGSLYASPGRADARLQAQTQQYVKDLAQDWINYANSAKLDQMTEADLDPKGKVPFEQLPPGLQQQVLAKEKGAQAPTADGGTAYKNAFLTWADQKMRTTETKTGRPISMDMVRQQPGMSAKLDQAINAIVANKQNPAKLQTAVEQYFMLVVPAIQQISKGIRQRAGVAGGSAHPPITVGTGDGATVYIHNGQQYVNAKTGKPLDPNLVKPSVQ